MNNEEAWDFLQVTTFKVSLNALNHTKLVSDGINLTIVTWLMLSDALSRLQRLRLDQTMQFMIYIQQGFTPIDYSTCSDWRCHLNCASVSL